MTTINTTATVVRQGTGESINIPALFREQMGIKAGDKLLLTYDFEKKMFTAVKKEDEECQQKKE